MKLLCPPGYYRNDFVATQALGHMLDAMFTEFLHFI